MSKKLSAAARFAIRTSPAPGSGAATSASVISSGSPQACTCHAFIVFISSTLLHAAVYDKEMIPTPAEAESAFQSIVDLEREYLLQNYARYPLALRRGRGAYVYDLDGKRYLDFIAGIGLNALVHAHPRIVKLMRQQAALLIHCSNLYYHEYQGPLPKNLADVSGL